MNVENILEQISQQLSEDTIRSQRLRTADSIMSLARDILVSSDFPTNQEKLDEINRLSVTGGFSDVREVMRYRSQWKWVESAKS